MILFPPVDPSWLRKLSEKTNFLIEVFRFRGLLIGMGFDSFKEPRSLLAVREGERRIRRSDLMKLLEGAFEWAGPPVKVASHKRLSLRFSLLEASEYMGGEFKLISPVSLVKPFHTLTRGNAKRRKEANERAIPVAVRTHCLNVCYVLVCRSIISLTKP